MRKWKYKLILALSILFCIVSSAQQEVNVILKNRNVVLGTLVEEKPEYIIVVNEIGETTIDRRDIESITYDPYIKFDNEDHTEEGFIYDKELPKNKTILNDRVVVYLRNGNVVSGILLGKSLGMVMIQTDAGRLTIPKRDLQMIEYVSTEYAERGENVIVKLINGTILEGYIFHEDPKNLTIETDLGRLTIVKNKLRSIEYTLEGVPEKTIYDEYGEISAERRFITQRLDMFSLGYSAGIGNNYSPGFSAGYSSRFLIDNFQGFYLSGILHVSFAFFLLDEESVLSVSVPGGSTIRGGAFATTIGAGPAINLYPQASSFYEFYVKPSIEGHIIYKTFEQSFPSFPALNSKSDETAFNFGIGSRFGLELIFGDLRAGISYNMHFIFGEDDFNEVMIHFAKKIF